MHFISGSGKNEDMKKSQRTTNLLSFHSLHTCLPVGAFPNTRKKHEIQRVAKNIIPSVAIMAMLSLSRQPSSFIVVSQPASQSASYYHYDDDYASLLQRTTPDPLTAVHTLPNGWKEGSLLKRGFLAQTKKKEET